MGNMKPIDSAVVKNETYDVLSADTMGGEYIETIGAACQNPDGYTSGSLFLGKDNDVQHLYRATAAIAFGETIILDTNCTYTTVSGELEGKAEESEVTSLNEALTNEIATTTVNGAHNLLPNIATSKVENGVTFIVNEDGSITVSTDANGATANTTLELCVLKNANGSFANKATYDSLYGKTLKLTGCPSGGGIDKYYLSFNRVNPSEDSIIDYGEGSETFEYSFPAAATGKSYLWIYIVSGTVITTPITFKPMLCLATDLDPTFQPYAKTNRELTQMISIGSYTSQSVNANSYYEIGWDLDDAACFGIIGNASYGTSLADATSNKETRKVRINNRHSSAQTIYYYLIHIKQ